jgi:hypothetical protein
MADNIIRTPGKFEGEPTYAEHFYNLMLDGVSDDTIYDGETPVDVFKVSAEDIAQFPDLDGVDYVILWESEQGFVYTREMTGAQIEAMRAEMDSDVVEDEG